MTTAPSLEVAAVASALCQQPRLAGDVVATTTPPARRTRRRVLLEEVGDAGERAQIVRNRAAAPRSNARRRAAREAGRLKARSSWPS